MKRFYFLFIVILLLKYSLIAQDFSIWQNRNHFDEFNNDKFSHPEFSDSNITQLSYYPLGMCNSVYVDSPYVYISNGNAMDVLEFSFNKTFTESNLVRIGRFSSDEPLMVMSVKNSYAYIKKGAYFDSDELMIIDIRNPHFPIQISSFYFEDIIRGLFVKDNLVYTTTIDSALIIINVDNPFEPVEHGYFETNYGTGQIFVSGNFAYVISREESPNKLYIMDVSDPTNPFDVGSFQLTNPYYGDRISDVFVVEDYAYLSIFNPYGPTEPLRVIDISNPSNPVQVGSFWHEMPASTIFISGQYAYMSATTEFWGFLPLHIVDICDPTQPNSISLDFIPGRGGNLFVLRNNLFITTEYGLKILDIQDPFTLDEVGFYDTGYFSDNIQIQGDYAYIAPNGMYGGKRDFKIFSVSYSTYPIEIANHLLAGEPRSLSISGHYGFLTSLDILNINSFLEIFDLTNPSYPILLSTYSSAPLQTFYQDIFALENYVYITTGMNDIGSLRIINVSNPLNPFEEGVYNVSGIAGELQIKDQYSYFLVSPPQNSNVLMYIVDITNPSNPFQVGTYETNSHHTGHLFISDNYVYLAQRENLLIIDVSDPSNPVTVASHNFQNLITQLFIVNSYLHIIFDSWGLKIYDVNDPNNFVEVGSFECNSWPYECYQPLGIFVSNRKIYLLSAEGFYILETDLPTDIEQLSDKLPAVYNLSQNYPNPFNPSTKISYQIPELSFVTLKIFDILGNEIETLVNEEKPTGNYEITWYAENLPSGVYFYRLQAGSFVETKKMVLMK